jgi:hypothetical protein
MHASFPPDIHAEASPLFELTAGFIFFSVALHSTLTGKVRYRTLLWTYRAEEPKSFWFSVVMLYLIGLFLVGRCVLRVSGT